MWNWATCLSFLVAFASPAGAFAAGAVDAGSLLGAMKSASGGAAWDHIRSLRVLGSEISGGATRSREELDDVRTGRFVVRVHSTFGDQGAGFDGVSSWIQAEGGVSYRFGDDDARLGGANAAYLAALAYWFPERRAATLRIEPPLQEGARTFDVVSITPEGGRPFSLWVDQTTHLLDRIIEPEAERVSVTKYSDYREVEGVKLPFRISRGRLDGDDWDVETVGSVLVNPPVPDSVFLLPSVPSPDFSMLNGKRSTTVPFRLENNIILLPVMLNDQGPFWADFDSGGGLLIQPEVAARLKLLDGYQHKVYGGGEGSVNSGRAMLETLGVGDARLTRQPASVFTFYPEKPELNLVGSELLQRFAVHLDFDTMLLTLTPLDQFAYHGDGTAVPFHFQDNQPEVYGTVDGTAGVFCIDTGDNGSLLLIAPFAARYGLYDRYQATVPYGGTAVGNTHGVMARVGRLALLGADGRPVVEIDKPLTRISQQAGGFDANRYVSGNIGLGALKQFNLTFDYRRQQIIFEKNHFYGADDPYNRTGLHLVQKDGHWVVDTLDPGSPAQASGIRSGDRILAVDGRNASGMTREVFRDLFQRPAGSTLGLELESGKHHRTVKLVLKDLV